METSLIGKALDFGSREYGFESHVSNLYGPYQLFSSPNEPLQVFNSKKKPILRRRSYFSQPTAA